MHTEFRQVSLLKIYDKINFVISILFYTKYTSLDISLDFVEARGTKQNHLHPVHHVRFPIHLVQIFM